MFGQGMSTPCNGEWFALPGVAAGASKNKKNVRTRSARTAHGSYAAPVSVTPIASTLPFAHSALRRCSVASKRLDHKADTNRLEDQSVTPDNFAR